VLPSSTLSLTWHTIKLDWLQTLASNRPDACVGKHFAIFDPVVRSLCLHFSQSKCTEELGSPQNTLRYEILSTRRAWRRCQRNNHGKLLGSEKICVSEYRLRRISVCPHSNFHVVPLSTYAVSILGKLTVY
jgi:hypothetical protein